MLQGIVAFPLPPQALPLFLKHMKSLRTKALQSCSKENPKIVLSTGRKPSKNAKYYYMVQIKPFKKLSWTWDLTIRQYKWHILFWCICINDAGKSKETFPCILHLPTPFYFPATTTWAASGTIPKVFQWTIWVHVRWEGLPPRPMCLINDDTYDRPLKNSS